MSQEYLSTLRRISEFDLGATEEDRLTLGRSPDNHIVVADPSISRRHAALLRGVGERWRLVDLGSSNGTAVNGAALYPDDPVEVSIGDQIRLGDVLLLFDRPPGQPGGPDPAEGTTDARRQRALVGLSEAMNEVRARLLKVANSALSVLLLGESGTGKELAAELLHRASPRRKGPFVVVNCPAVPESLEEAELFGVEKRVATGVDPRPGLIEAADGGTLFLDEIAELQTSAQAKLLRFLQNKKLERLGGRETVELDVRIVAATNANLEKAVTEGRFRLDLLNRLNTLTVEMPALRDRADDIPSLVEHFLRIHGHEHVTFSEEALQLLMSLPYPGNVRQLERFVLSAITFADGRCITPDDLPKEALRRRAGETEGDPLDLLYRQLVGGERDFWEDVREPFMRRDLSRDEARELVARAYDEAGGSIRQLGRLFHIEDFGEYKKLANFLRNHDLLET